MGVMKRKLRCKNVSRAQAAKLTAPSRRVYTADAYRCRVPADIGLQNWQAPTTTDSDENLSTPDAGIVLYLRCSNSPFHILESVVRRGLLSRPTDNVLFVRDDFVGADVATLAAAQASILQQLHLSMMPTHCGLRGHAFVRMERIAQAVQVGDSPYNMLTPSHL